MSAQSPDLNQCWFESIRSTDIEKLQWNMNLNTKISMKKIHLKCQQNGSHYIEQDGCIWWWTFELHRAITSTEKGGGIQEEYLVINKLILNGIITSTLWGRVTLLLVCVSTLGCRKLNFNQSTMISIQNSFENFCKLVAILTWPQCVDCSI